MNRNQLTLLNTLGLLGMTAVLLIGFILQFVLNELPCPLCLLQRIGFVMVAFGFMLNVVYGPQSRHYGIVLIGALYGVATSLRQVSLRNPENSGLRKSYFGNALLHMGICFVHRHYLCGCCDLDSNE